MRQYREEATTFSGLTVTTLNQEEAKAAVFIAAYGRKPTEDELKGSSVSTFEEYPPWELILKLGDEVRNIT